MKEITSIPNSLYSTDSGARLTARTTTKGVVGAIMHRFSGRALILAGFALYGIVLMVIEVRTSQAYVRNYFADIEGPMAFHAVNTSLSVWLLLGTALLFAVSASCVRGVPSLRRAHLLYLSQAMMFAYFAIDDRFKIHESVGDIIGIGDHFVLLAAAFVQILFLAKLGGVALLRSPGRGWLLAGWALALVMISIDALAPHDALLRLSTEDLAKSAAALAIFLWAWDTLSRRLKALKSDRHGMETAG